MATRLNTRQAGITALYLGIFATVWFSVPKLDPPLQTVLVVASLLSLATAVAGGVTVARSRRTDAAPRDRSADRKYVLIVVAEAVVAGLGAALLSVVDRSEFIPVLVGAVVGAHFVPLVPVLRDPLLWPLAAVVCLVAAAGLVAELASSVPAGHVIGPGTGLALLGYALLAFARIDRGVDTTTRQA